jgi:hypothetical protein
MVIIFIGEAWGRATESVQLAAIAPTAAGKRFKRYAATV